MKDGCGKPGVNLGQGLEQRNEIFRFSGATGGNYRDADGVAYGVQHLQVKTTLHTVGVDGIDNNLSGAAVYALADPTDGILTGIVPAAFCKDAELPVHPLDIHGKNNALAAVPCGGWHRNLR